MVPSADLMQNLIQGQHLLTVWAAEHARDILLEKSRQHFRQPQLPSGQSGVNTATQFLRTPRAPAPSLFLLRHRQRGLDTKYGHFPRKLDTSKKKRKRHRNDGRGPDTSKKLKATKKRSSEKLEKFLRNVKKTTRQVKEQRKLSSASPATERSNLSVGQGKFGGIKWSFNFNGNYYTNTCPLDSFLSLLYILHKGEVLCERILELDDPTKLLTRAFKELDENDQVTGGTNARMLFVNEFFRGQNRCDLWSDLDCFFYLNDDPGYPTKVCPVLDSATWLLKKKSPACALGENCMHSDGPMDRPGKRKPTEKEQRRLQIMTTRFSFQVLDEATIKKCLDECFKKKIRTVEDVCQSKYVETGELTKDGTPKQESQEICPGPKVYPPQEIVSYPQLAVFTYGQAGMVQGAPEPLAPQTSNREWQPCRLDQLPFQFHYMGKRWVLRGVILGDSSHFTAVARLETCWMCYN